MNQRERMEFVRSHRTAIFGYNRIHDGPSMSIVYYVMDGDEILVSTMAERGKAKAVHSSPKISLCVLDEKWPPTYLQVYCDASIETDLEAATEQFARQRLGRKDMSAGAAGREKDEPAHSSSPPKRRRVKDSAMPTPSPKAKRDEPP